ncbi:1-deoxy-D-xylulose-5-phosphate synthase [Porphyromonas macacae]|uniref:1-deoxy-D-xylulose-5-phosphate synthase n=1 Tax=Porphyromonas macacae TaxID=28115 RepID=A0A0A2E7L2_9PORP|nr:1-deoxy-D-xylulose-5-phosphate synthase [Porphyromonas macacae]KGN74868.1 1-deoxy-D-xylulose-5-phosphate synthase [Porphyromonas macacae]
MVNVKDIQEYRLLTKINSPADMRKLPVKSLPRLCAELRKYILDVVSQRPGHLGSSLGAVELTVALHYVFNTPKDLIVWDVGHQAYSHKILTGRRDEFKTLRQWGGIAGFPTPEESEYDTFAAGHASNSISAALGMAVAVAQKNEDKLVIAVIGDGSMTGGLAFEGLNNTSSFPNNLLIVLNDNNMSIDNNVGGLNHYMVDLLTSKTYNTLRYDAYRGLKKLKLIDDVKRKNVQRLNNSLKALVSRQNLFFDGFSIRYFGPIDGNNINRLVTVLGDIKDMKGPRILHIKTIKGKGYLPAEKQATIWHAPGVFDVNTGQRINQKTDEPQPPKFQDVFGKTLVEFAERDERIVGVTPAMPTGCSMTFMMKAFPKRTFDVGIAEGHAVTFSAGLSREGLIPFCNIYSSFTQRAYDQIIHDVALLKEHVILCLDRAGLVGEDGATHQGAFDLAYLRIIPNMTVCSPYDEIELRNLMYTAYKGQNGPIAIRYPRGAGSVVDWQTPPQLVEIGKGRVLQEGEDLAFLTIGPVGARVASIVKELKTKGYSTGHYDMVFIKPLDEDLLHHVAKRYKHIITVEDGCITGGMGTAVIEFLMDNGYGNKVKRLGIPDRFIPHGTPSEQYKDCGLDNQTIYETAIDMLKS